MRTTRFTHTAMALAYALTMTACGGGGGTPSTPNAPSDTGTIAATITITSSGVSPRDVTIQAGSRVTFVNNDSRMHEPASNPHPTHGSCPPLDQVGGILAGQSRTSGNFNTPGTCAYHDHLFDTDTRYNGTITVQ